MAITDDLKQDKSTGARKGGLSTLLVIAAAIFFGLIIVAAVLMLLRQGNPTLLNQQTIFALPALPSFNGGTLLLVLLTMILLVFVGIFTLLLMLVICVCGCGCGKRLLEILKKLGLLLPDLPKGLRAAALGFDVAAQAAHISAECLAAIGNNLSTVVIKTNEFHFPIIQMNTMKLWDALRDLNIPGFPPIPPPHWHDPDVITFKQDIDTYPFSSSGSLSTPLGDIATRVNMARIQSENLETKLVLARDGLNAVAHVFDGQ